MQGVFWFELVRVEGVRGGGALQKVQNQRWKKTSSVYSWPSEEGV